jgi:bacterioferritin-associated ferredoxin
MRFDELIPANVMGHMVPFDMADNKPAEVRHCTRCDARLSRYNPESQCSPCREKERDVIVDSLNAIFTD